MVKNPHAMWETWVWSLGWEDPLKESMATHSSILRESPWTEKLGRLYSPWGHRESDMTEGLSLAQHNTFQIMYFPIMVHLPRLFHHYLFLNTWDNGITLSPNHIFVCFQTSILQSIYISHSGKLATLNYLFSHCLSFLHSFSSTNIYWAPTMCQS